MLWLNMEELVTGAVAMAAAVLFGRLLYRTARRNPDSILVRTGTVGDMLCVIEVILVVLGPMFLYRAVVSSI